MFFHKYSLKAIDKTLHVVNPNIQNVKVKAFKICVTQLKDPVWSFLAATEGLFFFYEWLPVLYVKYTDINEDMNCQLAIVRWLGIMKTSNKIVNW